MPTAERLFWVETTHQPVAAFGKRTFNVGFPAVSPKSCRSPPDPMRSLHLEESGHSTLEPRVRASTPVNGEVSPPSAERRKAFELVRFGVAITDDSQKLLILAKQKN